MPCQPHIHAPELLYHPMAQGNHGQSLFLHAADSVACFAALQPIRVCSPFKARQANRMFCTAGKIEPWTTIVLARGLFSAAKGPYSFCAQARRITGTSSTWAARSDAALSMRCCAGGRFTVEMVPPDRNCCHVFQ